MCRRLLLLAVAPGVVLLPVVKGLGLELELVREPGPGLVPARVVLLLLVGRGPCVGRCWMRCLR